ncbi:MAG: ABC transporter permease [Oscillospiraceae bacterium]
MRFAAFASRNLKEIVRDKLNLMFGIAFPLVLLFLLSLIQSNIPVELFAVDKLTPGVAVFGLSFISLFSGMLIARDRTSSFMARLFTSPLSSADFIFGYTLPLIPMSLAQSLVCFAAAVPLGLTVSLNTLLSIVIMIPAALLYIGIGLLCGSLFTDKQVGGVCGALLTNVSAWLSGTWFDTALVGGFFQKLAQCLPFMHAVEAGRAALYGNYSTIPGHLLWVIGYAAVIFGAAIWVFRRKMHDV